MTTTNPIIKNLLIKDSSGNTQLIEVIQTAPGKFVTASGHSIKTSTTAGGGRTIIRSSGAATTQPEVTAATTTNATVQPTTPGTVRTSGVTVATTSSGTPASPRLLTIPIQQQQLIRPIKTEFGTAPLTPIQPQIMQRTGQIISSGIMQQVIQAGNQRLLLTQTPNGPQLTPITSISQSIGGTGQLATFVTTSSASPMMSPASGKPQTPGPTLNLKQTFISPILDHTGARKRVDFPSDVSYENKRRKAEKGGKGLRHFSMKVCEKVRTKGLTTYNEVADELVQEFASPSMGLSSLEQQFDQKNIRRRVYDALNVLMAMNIISKEKKEIKWLGLPTNSMQECTTLEKDRQKRIERLKTKTQQLHDLIIQQVAFKSLVERNKEREKETGPPQPHGSIHLPFLIVNTAKQTVIDCSISTDKMEYLFNFDSTFEIHDDIEVLKRMGLALGLDKGECTDENILKAKQVLPKALEIYIDQIGKRDEDWRAEFDLDFPEDSYFQNDTLDSSENVFEINSNLIGDEMSVEDLEMQAAIESLGHVENSAIDAEDIYGDDDDEDDVDEDELSE